MADDQDYAPVGYYDDEDELMRNGYAPAIPVNAAASSPAPEAGYAPVGSTEDLEARAAQPRVPAMISPDVPPVGSVEDLEGRAAQPRVAPVAAGPQRPQWKDYAPGGTLNPNPTGWRNFFAHLAGPKYWDAREKAAEENYKNATGEFEAPLEEQQKEAATEETRAKAEALLHPPAKPVTEPKTPQEVYARAVQQAVAEGRDPSTDPLVAKLADTITSIQKPTNAPGVKAVTLKLPSGQQVAGKVDHEGNLLTEDGQPAPRGSMLYQQPNYGQLVLPTKTVDVIGDNGLPMKMGWNEQTRQYDKPMGVSATGAYGHEMEQAGAVARGGEELIKDIQANKEQLGTLETWVKKYGLNTPIADPKLAGLQAELATFAALQPAMHGFRSHSALETFETIIGGLQKNPDATIESIRGILKTTHAINPNLNTHQNETAPLKYEKGLVRNGYEFQGGDPTKKENWKKVEEKK